MTRFLLSSRSRFVGVRNLFRLTPRAAGLPETAARRRDIGLPEPEPYAPTHCALGLGPLR